MILILRAKVARQFSQNVALSCLQLDCFGMFHSFRHLSSDWERPTVSSGEIIVSPAATPPLGFSHRMFENSASHGAAAHANNHGLHRIPGRPRLSPFLPER